MDISKVTGNAVEGNPLTVVRQWQRSLRYQSSLRFVEKSGDGDRLHSAFPATLRLETREPAGRGDHRQ
nr:MAG TPA: hypothetical protein [Caudoviricetes sp.]